MKPAWGLEPPEGATIAWGARAIYEYNRRAHDLNYTKRGTKRKRRVADYFSVSLMWDRMDLVGGATDAERKAFTQWLDDVGLPALRHECNERFIDTSSSETITIERDGYTLVASPRASYGYLYIGAWRVS